MHSVIAISSAMQSKLFDEIDDEIKAYRERAWEAVLPFRGFICSLVEDVPGAGDDRYDHEVNLFEYVRQTILKEVTIRFDPGIYDVSGGWGKKSDGQKLLTALCAASQQKGGCELKCNGGMKQGSNRKTLFCPKHQQYDSQSISRKAVKTGKPEPVGPLRVKTYHCDKNNTRGRQGLSMKKRTNTGRPLTTDETCKVNLIIDFDNKTYFMKCGIGQGIHTNHLPLTASEMAIRAKFVDAKMMDFQKQLAIANIEPGKTAAAVKARFGTSLTRRQVAYHQGFSKLANSLEDSNEIDKIGETCSDLDMLIDILKKKGAGFCALYHRSKAGSASELPKPSEPTVHIGNSSEDMLFTETGGGSCSEVSVCEMVSETTGGLGHDIMKYARDSRVAVNASDEQDVLLAIVWVLPNSKQLFRAYPEVVFIDGTHKTNYENRPLVTMGVKDSKGKMQIVLRAFVPNERAWLFRWLFQVATPSLLGASSCDLVRLQITDGDSQETSQLDDALKTVFKISKRRRCGWHIIDRGWERIVSSIGRSKAAKHIEGAFKYWLYSLMKDIETDEEYRM
jgi:hypothetical protein